MSNSILVLGGSGRTGGFVLQKALAANHKVHALVRNPAAITLTHDNLTLHKGTPENAGDIANAMQGCDAVISTLNNPRASDSPFAKPLYGDALLTGIINKTIATMKAQGATRIVTLGVAGANESFATAPWIMRQMIKRTNLGHAYRDHEGVEAALSVSGLDWTVGRAMMLGKKDGKGPILESYVVDGTNTPKPAMQISRAMVAQWMIDALNRTDLRAKAPLISQK